MVFITGDTHGDFSRFSETAFPAQREMTRDDCVIICGDFGGVWSTDRNDAAENKNMDILLRKPFTIFFVDGNHENFARLYSDEFSEVNLFGGKAHRIRENVFHLIRGNVFTIQNHTFFAMGGAQSHDIIDGVLNPASYSDEQTMWMVAGMMAKENKRFRINGISWWQQELPSFAEMNHGRESLKAHGNKVDFVLSHCLPISIQSLLVRGCQDTLTSYFQNLIDEGLEFREWFCGHYHRNERILGKYQVLYENIVRII